MSKYKLPKRPRRHHLPLATAIMRSGCTQAGIAARCSLHPAHLSRIVSGVICPTVPTATRIAGVLDLDWRKLWPALSKVNPE